MQQAVEKALENKYPLFVGHIMAVLACSGIYYLEKSNLKPLSQRNFKESLKAIYRCVRGQESPVFEVTYHGRIN